MPAAPTNRPPFHPFRHRYFHPPPTPEYPSSRPSSPIPGKNASSSPKSSLRETPRPLSTKHLFARPQIHLYNHEPTAILPLPPSPMPNLIFPYSTSSNIVATSSPPHIAAYYPPPPSNPRAAPIADLSFMPSSDPKLHSPPAPASHHLRIADSPSHRPRLRIRAHSDAVRRARGADRGRAVNECPGFKAAKEDRLMIEDRGFTGE